MVFQVIYVNDILLIGNDVDVLTSVKFWLAKQFDMKDLGKANYVLGIQLFRDRKNKMIAISQNSYIDKVLKKFSIQNSKKGEQHSRTGVTLSMDDYLKTFKEKEYIEKVPYASCLGSLTYAMISTRPNICYKIGIVSQYQSNPEPNHWVAIKHILNYFRRTTNYMLVYSREDLMPIGYKDFDFQSDKDSRKSTSGSVFTLGSGTIVWRSIKQICIAD